MNIVHPNHAEQRLEIIQTHGLEHQPYNTQENVHYEQQYHYAPDHGQPFNCPNIVHVPENEQQY